MLQLGIDCALLAFGLHFHELLFLLHFVQFSAFMACSGYTIWTTIENRGATCVLETNYIFLRSDTAAFFSWFILLRLLMKGGVYFIGKPVDSNNG